MDENCGEWVQSMGVASGHGYQDEGSPETSTCEVLRDISRKLHLTLWAIMAL